MKIKIEGEDFESLKNNDEITPNYTNDEIDEKYAKGEIRIVTEQARYPLTSIVDMFKSPNYILNPEFQRRHRWSIEKKSKLIESFIINVPIPPIFLYEVDFSVYEVMDGLQRMTAISQFYFDEYALEGLDEWKELNGKKYSELPEQVKKGIDRRYLSSIILLKETAKTTEEAQQLKQLVFERINSGGVKLESQESRNALYPGPLNDLTIKLARDKHFCAFFNIPDALETNPIPQELIDNPLYSKMQDAELVLRFFAYRHIDKWEKITLEKFLDLFLQTGNKFSESILREYKSIFERTMDLLFKIYGNDAFKLWRNRGDHWFLHERPTKVLYDPLSYVFSDLIPHADILIAKKQEIVKQTKDLHENNADVLGGRNTNKSDVLRRIGILDDFYKRFI